MAKNRRSSAKGPTPQLRSRTTRSSKPRLLTDPTSSTQLLTTQLQSLGLYAAPTIGDGNCLFRALSDQVHGSPEKHREVRRQVCDWIEQHKERYEGFVEDDDYIEDVSGKAGKKGGDRDKGKGLDAHLRCMRENATYGGHMELSAFAHLSKRNIKVIQPGLVYVIEWQAGESSTTASPSSSSSSKDENPHLEPRRSKRTQRSSVSSPSKQSSSSNQTENQQVVKIGTGKHGYYVYEEISDSDSDKDDEEVEESLNPDVDQEDEAEDETVYVAYHDWEHFSSIRNLRGPHAGLPHVKETPAQSVVQRERENGAVRERGEKERKRKEKDLERDKQKTMKVKLKISSSSASSPTPTSVSLGSLSSLSTCSSLTSIDRTSTSTADLTLIPLPNSRSVSPLPPIPSSSISPPILSATTTIPTISPPIPATPTSPTTSSTLASSIHISRSSSSSSHNPNPHHNSHLHQHLHLQHRSPKRTFDESSEEDGGSSAGGGGGSGSGREEKRSRVGSAGVGGRSRLGFRDDDLDADAGSNMDRDGDRDTPGLSAPGSSSETSSDSFSDLASPSPSPQAEPSPMVVSSPPYSQTKSPPKAKLKMSPSQGGGNGSKPLTRRQRKALGLPKLRSHLTSSSSSSVGAGKIVIPGGKWKGRQSQDPTVGVVIDGDAGGGDEEWRRNGTGRVDVRGFRELKI